MSEPERLRDRSPDDSLEDHTAQIELPESLVERVQSRLDRTEFETADEYVEFVLEETLARVEAATDDSPTDVAEDEIQSRLESLGYLE
jgi:Arc/MetJ-type ribon-helix-helix transcriptional regulator